METELIEDVCEFQVGEKVTYVIMNEERRFGIVKNIKKILNHNHVFVVYNCNEDWENYQNYTAQLTNKGKLFHGWNDQKPVLKFKIKIKKSQAYPKYINATFINKLGNFWKILEYNPETRLYKRSKIDQLSVVSLTPHTYSNEVIDKYIADGSWILSDL